MVILESINTPTIQIMPSESYQFHQTPFGSDKINMKPSCILERNLNCIRFIAKVAVLFKSKILKFDIVWLNLYVVFVAVVI